jgi:hypothetical protein
MRGDATPTVPTIDRCRYHGRGGVRCTGQVLDNSYLAEVWICAKHAGRVLAMIKRHAAKTDRRGVA